MWPLGYPLSVQSRGATGLSSQALNFCEPCRNYLDVEQEMILSKFKKLKTSTEQVGTMNFYHFITMIFFLLLLYVKTLQTLVDKKVRKHILVFECVK